MRRVLLVDDDHVCLDALRQRLQFAFRDQCRLLVDVADCTSTALILAAEHDYDAMLVDILMPGTTGLKFVEQIRSRQDDIPIIVMSGLHEDYGAELERLNVFAFLGKPLDFTNLRNLLTLAFESRPDRPARTRRDYRKHEPFRRPEAVHNTPSPPARHDSAPSAVHETPCGSC